MNEFKAIKKEGISHAVMARYEGGNDPFINVYTKEKNKYLVDTNDCSVFFNIKKQTWGIKKK